MQPEKTFVGRWEQGVEFLGLRMEPAIEAGAAPLSQPDAMSHAARTDAPARKRSTFGEVLETPPSGQVEVVVGSRAAAVEGDAASSPRLTRSIRLSPARAGWARFVTRMRRLYEQGASPERLNAYLRHWLSWFSAGLRNGSIAPQPVAF